MKPLYTLIIGDSGEDAARLVQQLHQDGFQAIYERVQTLDETRAALERSEWDVLIANGGATGCGARDVAALLRMRDVDVPFICVTNGNGDANGANGNSAADSCGVQSRLEGLADVIESELQTFHSRRLRGNKHAVEHFLAAIVESSHDAIYSRTLEGNIVTWNHAAERLYGYSAGEIIGRSISVLFPPDRLHELDDSFTRVERGEQVGRAETVRVRKDGSRFNVSVTVSPIKGHTGDVMGASIIARNITERKREEEDRLRLIAELTDALTHVKELKGLLPICASCKKIRDDKGYWQQVETYIKQRSDAEFTHGICPDCAKRLYPELDVKI